MVGEQAQAGSVRLGDGNAERHLLLGKFNNEQMELLPGDLLLLGAGDPADAVRRIDNVIAFFEFGFDGHAAPRSVVFAMSGFRGGLRKGRRQKSAEHRNIPRAALTGTLRKATGRGPRPDPLRMRVTYHKRTEISSFPTAAMQPRQYGRRVRRQDGRTGAGRPVGCGRMWPEALPALRPYCAAGLSLKWSSNLFDTSFQSSASPGVSPLRLMFGHCSA